VNAGYIGYVIEPLGKFFSPGIVDAFFFQQRLKYRVLFLLIDD